MVCSELICQQLSSQVSGPVEFRAGGRQCEIATARQLRTKGVGQGFEVCYRRTEEADHGLQDVAEELQDGYIAD